MAEELKIILPAVLSPSAAFIVVVTYLVLNPAKVDQWASLIYRFLSFVGAVVGVFKERLERGRIAADIQAVINTAGQELSKQSPGALAHLVRIDWASVAQAEAYLEQGEVIVRLDRHANQDRNIVVATLTYVSKGLLPRARMYVDRTLMRATDFTVAKRIFASARASGAPEYFVTHVLEPAIKGSAQLGKDAALLDELESVGFFSRIYLGEIRELGDRIQPAIPTERIHGEVRAFAEFLYRIATKARDEDVPLQYEGARLKVSIPLVARAAVLEEYGLRAHLRRIERLLREGFDSIYINGWGEPNVTSVRMLLRRAVKTGQLTVLRTYDYRVPRYRGESNRAILAVCASSAAYLRKRQESARPVIEALMKNIEEIAEGKWEVVEVARRAGYGSKAAIRVQDEPDVRGAIRALRARDPGLIGRLRRQLGGEPVFLVPWSSDVKEFIISALVRVNPKDVSNVELNEADLEAHVSINSERAVRAAVGRSGWCVQTAGELTGWSINIALVEYPRGISPEVQPIWDALNEMVPEVRDGTIAIRAIAREPGVGSKVVVGPGSTDVGLSPTRICLGDDDEPLSTLRAKLGGEWVSVLDWSSDLADLVVKALQPLEATDVVDVSIDEAALEATVLVRDSRAARLAIGLNGVNVRLAEAVTKCSINVRSEEGIG
jgi:transcription antitermination factor NusA-like protein